jgi:hypothetical protein
MTDKLSPTPPTTCRPTNRHDNPPYIGGVGVGVAGFGGI